MPIIQIHALPQKEEIQIPIVIQALADAVAQQMNIPAYAVRCIWQELKPMFYAQGGTSPEASQPNNSHGPLVTYTLFEGRGTQFVEKILHLIAETLASALRIDPNTICIICHEHKFYQVLDAGQIFTIKYPGT